MVFRAEKYPKNWREIRAGIVLRGNNRCEQCLAPNGEIIARNVEDGSYMLEAGDVFDAETGAYRGLARGSEYDADRFVKVILAVAHLDHDEQNNDPANLRALCQMHHLRHDARDNAKRRSTNARKADDAATGQGSLFDRREA